MGLSPALQESPGLMSAVATVTLRLLQTHLCLSLPGPGASISHQLTWCPGLAPAQGPTRRGTCLFQVGSGLLDWSRAVDVQLL